MSECQTYLVHISCGENLPNCRCRRLLFWNLLIFLAVLLLLSVTFPLLVVVEALSAQLIDEVCEKGLSVVDSITPKKAQHVGYKRGGCLGQFCSKVSI